MKKQFNYFVLLIITLSLTTTSCSKDGNDGEDGSVGPAGAQGTQGPIGPQGVEGNANVVLYTYGTQTFTDMVDYAIPNTSREIMDTSLVLAYYNPSDANGTSWYAVPGGGPGARYEVRSAWGQSATDETLYNMAIRTYNHDGSGNTESKTFKKFRIFVVKASSTISGKSTKSSVLAELKTNGVDVNDYHAICNYYGLAY